MTTKIANNDHMPLSMLKYLHAAADLVNANPFSMKTNDLKSDFGNPCCASSLWPDSDCSVANIILP